jgi:N-acetylglucosaminyldiphosphoundecaprenol N-acetyl-beta-D-mannosaminyltransferase
MPAHSSRQTVRVLGARVDVVSVDAAVERLLRIVENRRTHPDATAALVVTLNPEMVMLARRDPAFAALLEGAALLVPDGIGVARSLRRRGFPEAERVGGVDLLDAYLPFAAARGHRIALAGGGPGVAHVAGLRLRHRFPGLEVVAAEGGAPDARLAQRLREAAPELVCAAFGHGRQEAFLHRHLDGIGAAAGIGVGGWFDYLAGTARRAPRVVRQAGLEWAWRLGAQPWRLRRQLVLPAFWFLERREALALRRARSGG